METENRAGIDSGQASSKGQWPTSATDPQVLAPVRDNLSAAIYTHLAGLGVFVVGAVVATHYHLGWQTAVVAILFALGATLVSFGAMEMIK